MQRLGYYPRDGFLSEVHTARIGGVEVAVHPDERGAGIHLAGWGIFSVWQAAAEMAGYEEPLSFGMVMGETAVKLGHRREVGLGRENSKVIGR
jgi:hypothetical protein